MSDIDGKLAGLFRDPGIADAGFTEAVMQALPRRRMARTTARRLSLAGAGLAGGVAGAFLGPPPGEIPAALAGFLDTAGMMLLVGALLALPFLLAMQGER
jgi:anti-sigma factor RsiW